MSNRGNNAPSGDEYFARIKNLPTRIDNNGNIVPVGSFDERMAWYNLLANGKVQAAKQVADFKQSRAKQPTEAELYLEHIQERKYQLAMEKMSFREQVLYSEERRLKKEIGQQADDQKHRSSTLYIKTLEALGKFHEKMRDGEDRVKVLALIEAIKAEPQDVKMYIDCANEILANYKASTAKIADEQRKAAQAKIDEANHELTKSQFEASQHDLAATYLEANLNGRCDPNDNSGDDQ